MNEPWLCTRCNRMNAPFLPYCDCKEMTGSATWHIENISPKPKEPERCSICNGYHGGLQCATLRFS